MHRRRNASHAAVAVVATFAVALPSSSTARAQRSQTSPTALAAADVALWASLLEIADARRPDTGVVDAALRSSDPRVRAYAVLTIGQVGIRARIPELRRRLADPDSAIAANATFALGLLRDTSSADALRGALDGPVSVMEAAAWALGEMEGRGATVLASVLRDGQPAPALAAVLSATAKARPVPVPLVTPYLTHTDPAVRRSAVYALTRSRVPAAVWPLLRAAEPLVLAVPPPPSTGRAETEVEFRSYLARGLARTVTDDAAARPAAVVLERLLNDPHPHVRINAIRSVATFGSDSTLGEAARTLLLRHLRDPEANARIALAQSLTGVLRAIPEDWNLAWAADTGFTYRRSVLLSAMRARVRLPALAANGSDAWMRHASWRYRAAAAEAAGAGGFGVADEIAGALLDDADPRVRGAAYAAVLPFADSARAVGKPYARSALVHALEDTDPLVRATVLGAIRARARAAEASIALDAWRRAAADNDNDARVAALRVIAAAWAADSAGFGTALLDSLTSLVAPDDPLERAIVQRVSPLRHWPQTGAATRPTAWYVTQVRDVVARVLAGSPLTVSIVTDRGPIEAVLYGADAPLTVANFARLARQGYYNGLVFHRIVPNFVAQDGDPRGDGGGGPGYAIRDELNRRWYDRGAVGMALSGPDTGGSQYFITHSPQPHLDGHYTVFAHVTGGFATLDALVQGDRIRSVTIR